MSIMRSAMARLAGVAGFAMFVTVAQAAWSESGGSSVPPLPEPKFKVDRAGSGQLRTTSVPIRVYDAPKQGARLLRTYPPGAIMVFLGTAVGTAYVWVSPCNACGQGYVVKSEFLAGSSR